jgi:copper(I)-binding protein
MTSRTVRTVVTLLIGSAAGVHALQAPPAPGHAVAVRDAWVRVSTARRTSSSGYCRIENRTDTPVVLGGISAAGVGDAQVHSMTDQDGQMSMRPVAKLTIPPHATVDLAPGGMHIMLTDIVHPLTVGGILEMRFTFDDGETQAVRAVVRPLDAMSIR